MVVINEDILKEFKDRMHLGGGEDENLTRILLSSFEDLKEKCGDYTLEDTRFKELVFERSRYSYNDAIEYFNLNFQSQINSLGFSKAIEVIPGESIQIRTS